MANVTSTAVAYDDARIWRMISSTGLPRKLRNFAIAVSLLLSMAMLLPINNAMAGSRGLGVGIGVGTGFQILNQLSKGAPTTKRRASKSKRHDADTGKKSIKKARKQRNQDDDEKSAATEKDKDRDESKSEGKQTEADVTQEASPSGTPASAAAAPAAAIAAPVATGALSSAGATARELISTKDEITSAQEHLRFLGYDVPSMSGTIDLNTKIAIMKFQDSIGEEATGGLTVTQLQRLYVLADQQQKAAK